MSATTYETTIDAQAGATASGVPATSGGATVGTASVGATAAGAAAAQAPRIYRGRSIEELIPRIQVELGHDAIILRRRAGLTGGFAGFFQRRFVEIEARAGAPRVDLYDDPGLQAAALNQGLPQAGAGATAPALPQPTTAQPAGAGELDAIATAGAPNGAGAPMQAQMASTPATQTPIPAPGIAAPGPALSRSERLLSYSRPAPQQSPAAPGAPAPHLQAPASIAPPTVVPQSPQGPPPDAVRGPGGEAHQGSAWEPPAAPAPQIPQAALEATASNGHDPEAAEVFRELTPESLLGPRTARNGEPPMGARVHEDAFAAALARAEEALPADEEPMLATGTGDAVPLGGDDAISAGHAPMAGPRDDASGSQAEMELPRGRMPSVGAAMSAAAVRGRLLELGVGESLTAELLEIARNDVLTLMGPQASIADAVRLVLRLRIPRPAPLPAQGAAIALIGPGGSGKSSVCAWLVQGRSTTAAPAAWARMLPRDAQRGYALALTGELPEPAPIADPRTGEALRRAREGGLLLLDTPALSPGDRASIYELAELLDTVKPDRVILTLPATLGARPAAQLMQAMRPLGASALAITHADETDQLGVAVHAACAFGLAPVYILGRGEAGLRHLDPGHLADRLLT